MYCTNLQSFIIPKNISISPYCFFGCPNLTTVIVQNGDQPITIGDYAFAGDCFALENIILPDNLTTIGHYSFYGATSLTTITIPRNLTTIYQQAFVKSGLTKAFVNKTDGWQYLNNGSQTPIDISSSEMSDPSKVALLLLNASTRTFICK